MRDTGFGFAVGAISATGLPPGAAFAPQLLLYGAVLTLAITGALPARLAAIAVLAGLAIADIEAIRTFFRLYRRVFLGAPTGSVTADAVEVSSPRRVPLHLLAILALGLGLAPLVGLIAVSGPAGSLVAGLRSNRLTSALDAALRLGRLAGLLALLATVLAATAAAGMWLWTRHRARAAQLARDAATTVAEPRSAAGARR
jgi:NADH:ubiquinone oxidoreductase subunit 5 (subunit L)/multisubunit Na+/H+ antiporter MnhA subunit